MTINLSDFGIDRLSDQEQIQLAEAIYLAVESRKPNQPISAELKAELDRRIAEYRANPEAAISGDEMIARAMARIGQ
jgi:putative addiction module component (TIGR02574 family)